MVVDQSGFVTALAQFRSAYEAFFALLDQYPTTKQERAGACGYWTPKQVVAHLSGWLVEANKRYRDFASGDASNITYEEDHFNARSVALRLRMGWDDVVNDLHVNFGHFIDVIDNVPVHRAAADPRYVEWLTSLTQDCLEHTEELKQFLQTG